MKTGSILRAALALSLALTPMAGRADALAAPPAHWRVELLAVAASDLSGAERLMQQAVADARAELSRLLAQPGTDRTTLAGGYGRLGALFLLLEMEAAADACFRNAHRLQPGEFRWPYYAGYLAMMAGNTDRALGYLETARGIEPDYPTLYLRLGKVRLDRSELVEAKTALERIADAEGLVTAANYYLGQIAVLERRFEDAVAHLQRALEADPLATEVHYPLAQAYRALGEDDLAREHLGRFKLKEPTAADPLLEQLQGAAKRSLPFFHKGIHAVRQGRYAEALERFAEGLAIDPQNIPARVSYARALYLAGQGEQATGQLERALADDPQQGLAWLLLGVLAQQKGDGEAAAEHYRRALAIDPDQAGARFYLANLDFAEGRFALAEQGYRRVLALEQEIPPARLLALIAALRAGEREADVAARLTGLVRENPDDPLTAYALGRLLAAARDAAVRDPRRALELAERLALLQPIPPHLRLLALAQAANGRHEEAAATQEQVVAMAGWMAQPGELALMERELAIYRDGGMPSEPWPPGDPLLGPPPFDPVAPFRDYPAAVPY